MSRRFSADRWKRRTLPFVGMLLICIVFVLAGGSYWTSRANGSGIEKVSSEITRGTIKEVVLATGKILPSAFVDVGAQASGSLDHIHVKVGDMVESGDLLAEIDPKVQAAKVEADRAQLAQLEADLAAQQAEAEYANAQRTRNEKLAPTSSISQSTYDLAIRDSKSAAAKVASIEAQIDQMASTLKSDEVLLGYTKIYAPMAGTVVSVDAREGQTLNAAYSTPIVLRIAKLDTMTVWAQVSEADVTRLHIGMEVSFTTLGHGDRQWTGQLRQILPVPQKPERPPNPDGSSGGPASMAGGVILYTALFDVDNAGGDLRPEMTAQVSFVAAKAVDVVVAPAGALHAVSSGDNKAQVSVIDAKGQSETRDVKTGLKTRFEVEILSGLSPGDRVITGTQPIKASRSLFGFQL